MDFIKIKNAIEKTLKMKRQATYWEKIFGKYIADKKLFGYLKTPQLNNKKTNNATKKLGKRLE